MQPIPPELLSQCALVDAAQIKRRLGGLKRVKDANKRRKTIEQLTEFAQQSAAKMADKALLLPPLSYPESLPVSQKKDDIKAAIEAHQVVIVAGETGSGKTTQLPKICMELGRGVKGYIGHTQPRRLAARSVATRIAQETNTPMGSLIGYKVRFADELGDSAYVKLMTDGIMLAEMTQDKWLTQYDTIIIDEAHERSLNIDFLIGYIKQLLPKRPDLKLIITSATIDVERFSKHFNNAPVIEVSGRTFPVETRYRPLLQADGKDRDVMEGIADAVSELCREGPGDILVFLNGEREIRDAAEHLAKVNSINAEILPLYARLSFAEQSKIFSGHSGRRIVLSTNVAETSLTVPGIRYVVDTGTARISRYSYRTKVQRLPIEAISQASANQRQGRCGRVGPGICIRLFDEDDFNNRPEFTDPEILRTNLASVILQMLSIGLGKIADFPFIQPPDSRTINDGMRLLEELGAITQHKLQPKMTPLGRELARLPIDPRLARMVLQSRQHDCVHQVMVIAAALSIQDPRERPADFQQKSDEFHSRFKDTDSDFAGFLKLWEYLEELSNEVSKSQFRKRCKQEFLNYLRIREWQDLYYQLSTSMKELGAKITLNPSSFEPIHQSILAGMLSHIGVKDSELKKAKSRVRNRDANAYLGARNSRFYVFPGSALAKKSPKWLMAAELVETSRLFARVCGKISPEWVEPLAQHLVKRSYAEPHFDVKQQSVVAFETQVLYGLTIVNRRKCQYGKINPVEAREVFIRQALVEAKWPCKQDFFLANQKLIHQVENLEHKSRRRDILVDEQILFDFYDKVLPDNLTSVASFNRWWKQIQSAEPKRLHFDINMLMQRDADHISQLDFPDVWIQQGIKLPLSYRFEPGEQDDGVSLHVPLTLLNQLDATGFDWLVPGLRQEKLIGLIKSLPKTQRRNFVPAPNYADAILQTQPDPETDMLEYLCKQLLRMTGVRVSSDDFSDEALSPHLRLNIKVEDDKGKVIAQGRDLEQLKLSMQGQVKGAIRKVADSGIEKKQLTDWNFGELKQEYNKQQGRFEVKAYPALVDDKKTVSIQLFDDEQQANAAHRAGLRRLLLLNIPSPLKHLQQTLPNKAKLAMYFNPFGQVQWLIEDLVYCGVDKLIEDYGEPVRTEPQFQKLQQQVRAELNDTVTEIALQVEKILTLSQQIRKQLKGKIGLELAFALSDIQAQHEALVYKGFVAKTGWQRLADVIRYLSAIDKRLEKLKVDPTRDRNHALKVQKVMDSYQASLSKLSKGQPVPTELAEVRWMIEEYRVSCFAQNLGTRYPISDKRIMQVLNQF
ncbi:ATP-dependent RNA helicase HrpA [Paraferrimonas haliotis]|uniref:RNA helicase n=1 Tax=Paraferrimonas haliotis TaxID=2013866 RepID=A0AA37TS67_9GAMM|nr:ATP-dependent RNA helicase HrpA [Paraferrimonas haliotis]GLS84713.1 ATP-dependent helicase [Paraferrimonas haliotis]